MNNSVLIFISILASFIVSIFYLNSVPGLFIFLLVLILLITYIVNLRKFKNIFMPISITYIALIISFVVKGLYIIDTQKFSNNEMILPYIYILIFVGFFSIGFSLSGKSKKLENYLALSSRELIDQNKIKKIILIFIIIAIVLFVRKIGISNITTIFSNVLGNRILFQNEGGLYTQTIILILLQFSLYLFIVSLFEKHGKFKFSFFLIFILAVNLFIPMTLGGRGMIFTPILMTIYIMSQYSKSNNYVFLIFLGVFVVLFSGWYGMFRDGIVETDSGSGDFIKNVLDRYVQLDNLTRLSNNKVDIPFGKSVVDFLYSPIPRSLFPDKPYNFNSQMTQIYLPLQFQNKIVSDFTAIGELLINFGIVGVAVGGFVFGKLIDIYNKLVVSDNSLFIKIWYPFMMLKPMSILYGGMINSTVNMMLLLETPLLIILWIIVTKRRKEVI